MRGRTGPQAIKRTTIEKVLAKQNDQKSLDEDLQSLKAGFVGEPVQDALIDAVKSASETAKALLVKAEGIKKQYAGSTGLGGSIAATDLLSSDAEVQLGALAESAGKESSGISAAKAGFAEWEKSFGGIRGASSEDRESWEKALEAIEDGSKGPGRKRQPICEHGAYSCGSSSSHRGCLLVAHCGAEPVPVCLGCPIVSTAYSLLLR